MSKELRMRKSVRLHAAISDVWEALTNPEITKQYLFGCKEISDWNVGSPINFNKVVDGKEQTVVKGVVTAIERHSLLEYTSIAREFEQVPSKHTTVTYRLSSGNDVTELSVTQGDFEDRETYDKHDTAWDKVLEDLKALVEAPQ